MVFQVAKISLAIDNALQVDQGHRQHADELHPTGVDRMSSAGRCYRERWAVARGVPLDPGKGFRSQTLRIFRMGHIIEDEVVRLIEEAGFPVFDQQREVGSSPWLGHIDGLIEVDDRVSLLEIKSCNDKRFGELLEVGYEQWSPGYAAQLQAYMFHIPEVEDAIVAVYNKNDSRLYFERILFDLDAARELERHHLLAATPGQLPPPRPPAAKSQYGKFCKWCDRNQWCWSSSAEVQFDD